MPDHNTITIDSYNISLEAYIDWTPNKVDGNFKLQIEDALSYILKSDKILELWSGLGRDADYMEELGYAVIRSDYPDSFLKYQQTQWKNIRKINILDLPIQEKYKLIFANAVLLHFDTTQVKKILYDISEMLLPEGVFAFSVKEGEWEEFSPAKLGNPRYFKYRKEEELGLIVEQVGLKIKKITTVEGTRIHIIAQKTQTN